VCNSGNSDSVVVDCSTTYKWSINPIIQNPVYSHTHVKILSSRPVYYTKIVLRCLKFGI
jgi:hypothetical protein